ncbi:hypothetical protein DY000_02030430 [Brassica cretica]|uniref:Uncharacterized protein n=1 Tax=Brassica cretica TaxID=69181 RepID=A0ABQ7DPL0_BRACR|nr:hypothetical protein DY000_02030430 [Brassica cretica]
MKLQSNVRLVIVVVREIKRCVYVNSSLGTFGYHAHEYAMTGQLTQKSYTVKSKLHLLTFLSEDKVKQCVDPKLKGEWSQHKLVAKFYEINCAAYGTVAEKLYENWFSSTAKVVVCVLQLWQIEWGEGCLSYITNFEECLDNLFDPRIP